MNHCVKATTEFSPGQLTFSHSSGTVAHLSVGAQALVIMEGGESFEDIQLAVPRLEKAAENLTKVFYCV